MKTLRIIALVLALAATGTWLATGANRGWTKTSVAVKTVDEITGLEAISYERQFLPGVEFLAAALLGASLLAGASFLFRKSSPLSALVPPSPGLGEKGRGELSGARANTRRLCGPPSPGGEGRGEGERTSTDLPTLVGRKLRRNR